MPKFTKCWFKDCDSDNREGSKLLFYKFPKDSERCEQWVNNCANPELTGIWMVDPNRVGALRICQKHFLKEFLGSSCRLVGHAVPAPYGIPLDQLNAEKFMVECASLKCTSKFNNQNQRNQLNRRSQEQLMPSDAYGSSSVPISTNQTDNYLQPTLDITNINLHNDQPAGLLMTVDQSNYHQQLVDNNPLETCDNGSTDLYSSTTANQYMTDYAQQHQDIQPQEQPVTQTMHIVNEENYSYSNPTQQHTDINQSHTSYQHDQQQSAISITHVPVTTTFAKDNSRTRRVGNPKIIYDRDGRLVSIQYQTETLSMLKTDDNEQRDKLIEALKLKVNYYQRRLAVTNHRYQKLRGQQKGRSHKTRLLEYLKICKKNFEPCVLEIFKRQIKKPTSKHGNRWSNDVKSFASSIYVRSSAAYKFIRKTIDLPSESIVKRFIADKKLHKIPQNTQPDDSDNSEDEDVNECEDDIEYEDSENDDVDDINEVDEPSTSGLSYVNNAHVDRPIDSNLNYVGEDEHLLHGGNLTLLD